MKTIRTQFVLALAIVLHAAAFATTWDCEILPSEQQVITDKQSGAKIIFATTDPASDQNLYFHDRCFLLENRLALFISDRFQRSEIMGYLLDTGELVRLNRSEDTPASNPLASIKGDKLFVTKENCIYQWQLRITTQSQTAVRITERKLVELPAGAQTTPSLAENCDGSLLSFIYEAEGADYIAFYNFAANEVRPPTQIAFSTQHLQFHWNRPDLLSFCRSYGNDHAPLDPNEPRHARIWFMNVDTRVPTPAFYQVPGELATHECWWRNDQMTFIGGHHQIEDREEGHVKLFDLKTGDIRIIGAGAWWEEGTASQVAKMNWWHAAGSPNGKWVAADNWHGIIALFDAKTTEKKILTTGHRTYGKGNHLHVGWDLTGKHVEFTSNRHGNPDFCLAVIPEDW